MIRSKGRILANCQLLTFLLVFLSYGSSPSMKYRNQGQYPVVDAFLVLDKIHQYSDLNFSVLRKNGRYPVDYNDGRIENNAYIGKERSRYIYSPRFALRIFKPIKVKRCNNAIRLDMKKEKSDDENKDSITSSSASSSSFPSSTIFSSFFFILCSSLSLSITLIPSQVNSIDMEQGITTTMISASVEAIAEDKDDIMKNKQNKVDDKKQQKVSPQAIRNAKLAFRAYDNKDLVTAEALFDKAISAWRECTSCRDDEIASLLKVRGNVRVDVKRFVEAISDYNEVIAIMEKSITSMPSENNNNVETSTGISSSTSSSPTLSSSSSPSIPSYSEYADVFAQRGLAYEGLSNWESALSDYNKAIALWGDGRSEDINPFVLTFRGNTLAKLNNYKEAIKDYRAAGDIFLQARDDVDANYVRANYALAMYEVGESAEAKKVLQDVVRRDRGYADGRVALAAIAWSEGDLFEAEKQWTFTCDNINVGCKFYKDQEWVTTVRRWPPSMSRLLENFIERKDFAINKPSLTLQEQIQLR